MEVAGAALLASRSERASLLNQGPLGRSDSTEMRDSMRTTAAKKPECDLGDELRMLHDTVISDLAFLKTQQWQVAGYAGALDAALIAVARIFGTNLDAP